MRNVSVYFVYDIVVIPAVIYGVSGFNSVKEFFAHYYQTVQMLQSKLHPSVCL